MIKHYFLFLFILFTSFVSSCKLSNLAPERPQVIQDKMAVRFVDHTQADKTGCIQCHENRRPKSTPLHGNNSDCNECHLSDFIKAETRSWTYLKKVDHSKPLQSCNKCHLSAERDSRPIPKENHPTAKYNKLDCIHCHKHDPIQKNWKTITFDQTTHFPNPNTCNQCHEGNRPVSHTINPKTSGMKSTDCFACHGSYQNWNEKLKQYDHVVSTPQSCLNCHKNDAPKPSENHPSKNENYSKLDCKLCHTYEPKKWNVIIFDHKKHQPENSACLNCHNSSINTSLPPNGSHQSASRKNLTCNQCHTFAEGKKWLSFGTFNHNKTESSESCESCHNSSAPAIKYKTEKHVPTKLMCIDCHTTKAWKPATYKHLKEDTKCLTCHNGQAASDRPKSHTLKTNVDCNVCHSQSRWAPAWYDPTYKHSYEGNLSPKTSRGKEKSHIDSEKCMSCHNSKNDGVRYKTPNAAPNCLGCHMKEFREENFHQAGDTTTVKDCLRCHHYDNWSTRSLFR